MLFIYRCRRHFIKILFDLFKIKWNSFFMIENISFRYSSHKFLFHKRYFFFILFRKKTFRLKIFHKRNSIIIIITWNLVWSVGVCVWNKTSARDSLITVHKNCWIFFFSIFVIFLFPLSCFVQFLFDCSLVPMTARKLKTRRNETMDLLVDG